MQRITPSIPTTTPGSVIMYLEDPKFTLTTAVVALIAGAAVITIGLAAINVILS
jgi:hypothetical protein